MISRYAMSLLHLFVLTGSALFLAACTGSLPVPTNPPLYAQQKIQAADHWDTIADEVAAKLVATYEHRADLLDRPVYIKRPNDKPFAVAFENLLRTRLVTRGMQVARRMTPDAVVLEYEAQLILYNSARRGLPSLADLGFAVVQMVSGRFTTGSDHEVIIKSRALLNNRFVMHISSICYINDADWSLYASPFVTSGFSDTHRTIRMTGR